MFSLSIAIACSAAKTKELTPANANQPLKDSQLIVDVFDNSVARQAMKIMLNN
ncbi:MAG: hypothetical protein V7K48_01060 [Nostoc sp.]